MKTKYLSIAFICLLVNLGNAQELLNLGYSHGTLPTNINTADVVMAYTSWKANYTENCGTNSIRVRFDTPSQTVSEGIGYGMLIAAYAGDQPLLDGLWNYYTSFLNSNGVMNWKIDGCTSIIGQNGATDAELDVAMALIIASKKWGDSGVINYNTEAKSLINIIKTHEIELNTNVLKPGDAWGGSSTTNISYYAPGYYRAYKELTNDSSWDNVASKSYDIIALNQSKTGAVYNLVSDWCKADGTFSSEVSWAVSQGQRYGYDASRTPWRIALDYLWYGNTDALAYSNKAIDFINAKGGLDNIYPGYNLDGTAFEQSYKDITFTGAFAVAAMASNNQGFVNTAYSKIVNMTSNAYFGSTLRVLYLLSMSGNFYSPEQLALLSNDQVISRKPFSFYPNPVKNNLEINFEFSKANTLSIYTVNGKLLFNKTYNLKTTVLDVAYLKSGLYFIEINNRRFKLLKG